MSKGFYTFNNYLKSNIGIITASNGRLYRNDL